jgi:rhodanese-related sulfurtransferase
MTRLWRQDLAWAGLILVMAAGLGYWQEHKLIPLARELGHIQVETDKRHAEHQHMKAISLATTYNLFQQGKALFIDARPAREYAERHIPRALNLPPEELEKSGAKRVAGIAKDRKIVVYCSSVNCDLALDATEKLESLGFTRIVIFWDGFFAWNRAGYPVTSSR